MKTNGNGKNKGCRRQEEEKKPAGLPLPNVDVCQGRKNTFGSPSDAAAAAAADDEDDEDDEDPSLRDEPNLRRHSRRVVTSVGSGILPTRYELTFSLSGRREGALREKQSSSALLDG